MRYHADPFKSSIREYDIEDERPSHVNEDRRDKLTEKREGDVRDLWPWPCPVFFALKTACLAALVEVTECAGQVAQFIARCSSTKPMIIPSTRMVPPSTISADKIMPDSRFQRVFSMILIFHTI